MICGGYTNLNGVLLVSTSYLVVALLARDASEQSVDELSVVLIPSGDG